MTAVPTPPLPAGPAYRPAVDVSHLPETAFGTRTTLWWGNTLLLFIETTMFALLAATYFYLRQNFHEWPPVQPNTQPPIYHPLPDLWASTAVLAVLVAACVPMAMAHVAALRLKANLVRAGMLLAVVAGNILRSAVGKLPAAVIVGSGAALITWFIAGAVLTALAVGVLALILTLSGVGLGHGLGGYYGGRRGGGGFGGGFGGGGGGFGVGGASGRW